MTDGRAPAALIPRRVLDAFGLTGAAHPLPGGDGQCVRVGSVVLKPAEDGDETTWVAQLLTQAAEAGPVGRWPLLLAAARAFHTALRPTPMPTFLARRTHRWALADRVAWGEATFEPLPAVRPLIDRLTAVLRPVSADCQLVHGDLSGNVLFADGLPPAIIDFSPYWRPAAYADAIIAVDGLVWHKAGRGLLTLAWATPEFPQMLVRALVFRLVALNEQARSFDDAGLAELARFEPVVTEVESLARGGHACPV